MSLVVKSWNCSQIALHFIDGLMTVVLLATQLYQETMCSDSYKLTSTSLRQALSTAKKLVLIFAYTVVLNVTVLFSLEHIKF